MAFVFYDTETTGSEPFYDQILQFAAIRTDGDLVERETFEIRCRLQPHIVPSPGALLVTGVGIDRIVEPGLPSHYQMVASTKETLLSWSPAVFAGYNSLEFDEDLLRQALYQTLHPPFLTNTNGNSRLDILQLALAVNAFEPGVLIFPPRFDGKPSFRLDQVAPANGYAHREAHDALADARATIHVAKLIRMRARDFWDHMVRMGSRTAATDFALREPVRLYTEFHYNRPHHWMVSPIAVDPQYRGHVISLDLAHDPTGKPDLDDDGLVRWIASPAKPLRAVKANACPIILPWQKGAGRVEAHALGEAELCRRAMVLWQDADFRQRLVRCHAAAKKPAAPSPYLEGQIYDGFPGYADEVRRQAFHRCDWRGRLAMAGDFEDRRLRHLARRLVYLECPDVMDRRLRTAFSAAAAGRMLAPGKMPWMTLHRALDDANALLEHASSADAERLQQVIAYLQTLLAWAQDAAQPLS